MERGLRLRNEARDYEKRPQHDLLLLHCAIFGSDDAQLNEVVGTVSDAAGDKGTRPADVGNQFSVSCGELYAAAWCGMLKHARKWVKPTHSFHLPPPQQPLPKRAPAPEERPVYRNMLPA